MTNGNDRAFATQFSDQEGLTKREYFAAMAMQGIMANSDDAITRFSHEDIALIAVSTADALIAELNKEPKQ